MDPVSLFRLFVIAFVVTVAVGDVLWQKIPRSLTTVAFCTGLIYHIFFGGFGSSLMAGIVGLGAGLLFYRMGAIGGGDVKLLAALGALLGMEKWVEAMAVAILAAALIAVVQSLRRSALPQTLHNCAELVRSLPRRGLNPHESIHIRSELAIRAPFGIAAAVGTAFILVRA